MQRTQSVHKQSQHNKGENKKKSKQNENFAFIAHRFYTTFYHTYPLLQCKEHIQITSNNRTINVDTKKNNRVNKITTLTTI